MTEPEAPNAWPYTVDEKYRVWVDLSLPEPIPGQPLTPEVRQPRKMILTKSGDMRTPCCKAPGRITGNKIVYWHYTTTGEKVPFVPEHSNYFLHCPTCGKVWTWGFNWNIDKVDFEEEKDDA